MIKNRNKIKKENSNFKKNKKDKKLIFANRKIIFYLLMEQNIVILKTLTKQTQGYLQQE